MAERDFLDKLIAARQARNPDFGSMVEAARQRRELQDAPVRRDEQLRPRTQARGPIRGPN